MALPQSITEQIQRLKANTELCICGRWRKAGWPINQWTERPPAGPPAPPQHETTPRTCPDCHVSLRPSVTKCSYCDAWRWYGGPVWYPGPASELALASHDICPGCKKKIADGVIK